MEHVQLTKEQIEELGRLASYGDGDNVSVNRVALFSLANEALFHRSRAASELTIETLVSARTGEGIVEFGIGSAKLQFGVPEAMDLILQIAEAAASAESDAFLASFLRSRMGVKDPTIFNAMLTEFRQYKRSMERPARVEKRHID